MNSQSPSSPSPLNLITKGDVISGGQLSGLKIQTKQERKEPHTWDLEGEETGFKTKWGRDISGPLIIGSFNPSNTQNFLFSSLYVLHFLLLSYREEICKSFCQPRWVPLFFYSVHLGSEFFSWWKFHVPQSLPTKLTRSLMCQSLWPRTGRSST